MEWKVTNALSRDVEREQLNKILKEIKKQFSSIETVVNPPVRPAPPPVSPRLPVTVTLTGDVTGTATGTGQITIDTELQTAFEGVEEAPDDGDVYWRGGQQWQSVPLALQSFSEITGGGFLSLNEDGWMETRVIEGEVGQIEVEDGGGIEANPLLSLADVPNEGGGELQKTAFDSKGRLTGSSSATTDDLEEGATNLYFTNERAVGAVQELLDEKLDYDSLKATLVAGANITLTPDDLDSTITITSTGGGGGEGTVEAVIGGTGIEVDATVPEAPIVSLSGAVLDSLALADSAVQPSDLAPVATSGAYADLTGLPILGTMAAEDTADYTPTAGLGSAAFQPSSAFATSAQGTLANTALQPGDTISELINDAGYTSNSGTVTSVGLSVPTGLAVGGSPVTTSGTLSVAYAAGYQGYTTTESSKLAGISPGATANTGTVTSVGASVPTGLSVAGSPVTGAGTLAFSWSSGYQGYTSAEAAKLSGIAAGAQVNVATNLAQGTRTATTVPVTSSTGSSATLAAATASLAGVMTSADKTKLDGIASGATVGAAWATNLSGIPANITAWAGIAPATKADVAGNNTFTGVNAFQNGSVSGGMSVGANVNSSAIANGARKIFRATMPAFNNSTVSPMFIFGADTINTTATNVVRFGGWSGASGITAATRIIFSTGSAVDEVGGSDRWEIDHGGHFSPMANNAYNIGSGSARIMELFAANGTINTSDAREKTPPRDMTSTEIACALDIARLPCIFQWLESIAEKGDNARLHCGPTVQDVISCMESHGLDPFRYSFVCYDSWPEQQEVVESWDEERDDEGNVIREAGSEIVQEYRPAGDRYSLRPSGLDAFCRRALVADRDALEARLSALENKAI